MLYRFLVFALNLSLFAASSSAVVALGATSQQVVYQIDVSYRGADLISAFNSLKGNLTTNYFTPPLIEVQTTTTVPMVPPKYGNKPYGMYSGFYPNAIIPFVQNITGTTYNTLLIVTYYSQAATSKYPLYVVLPVEQVTCLLYFPTISNLPPSNLASSAPAFISTFPSGIIPFFSVAPQQRAVDIVSAVNQLIALFPQAPNSKANSQVWIQTTVNGPYMDPSTPNGLIQNVLGISLTGNYLLQITYQPSDQVPQNTGTVYVSPEQVQQILFVRYQNQPSRT